VAPKAKVEKKNIERRKRKKKPWKFMFMLVDMMKFSRRTQQLEIYHIYRYCIYEKVRLYLIQLLFGDEKLNET
jgi:hypothetical protein